MINEDRSLNEYKRRIIIAMEFIDKNLSSNPTLEEIADAACFSKFHFHRIFSAIVGETIAVYTRRLKLEKAANKLIYSDLDITYIAHEYGFSSSQNFAKAFKKHFKQSPKDFRNIKSKNGNTRGNTGNDKSARQLYNIDHLINNEELMKRIKKMDVKVKKMPDFFVAYVRVIGEYGPENCSGAHKRLMQWAGPRGLINEKTISIGVSRDNPEVTPPEKCRYDACITIEKDAGIDKEIETQIIPGGDYAVYSCEVDINGFGEAWCDLMDKWIPSSGYQPDDKPCYEICHNDPKDGEKYIVDICCPVIPL